MTMPSDDELRDLLRASRVIAVVGLSPKPIRPSHSVSKYLKNAGYTIVPINPGHGEILGAKSYATLTDAAREHTIDIVDIFRRSELVAPVVDEAIALAHRPKLIWLQQGVVDAAAEQRARAEGIAFVMDQCIAVEHRHLEV
jgi:predicted CoA-binding protein